MTGGNPLARYFDEHYPDALAHFGYPDDFRYPGWPGKLTAPATWAQDASDGTPAVKAGSFLVPPVNDLTIRKVTGYIQVPDELLMDAGVIPDTRPPLPPPTWRTRLRWKRDQWRESAARAAFRLIAGYEVPDGLDE